MKFKSNFLLVIICLVIFAGCVGPLVPVIDMANVDPQDLHGVQRCRQPKQRGKRHNEQGGKGSGQLKF